MGVPSYPIAHEQRYASYILNSLLGGGMSSRLFQNIRERQGLAYAIYSDLSPYRDTGCLCVYAGTSRESAGKGCAVRCERVVPAQVRNRQRRGIASLKRPTEGQFDVVA